MLFSVFTLLLSLHAHSEWKPLDQKLFTIGNRLDTQQENLELSTSEIGTHGPLCDAKFLFTAVGNRAAEALSDKMKASDGTDHSAIELIRYRRERITKAIEGARRRIKQEELSQVLPSLDSALEAEEKNLRETVADSDSRKSNPFAQGALGAIRGTKENADCMALMEAIDGTDRNSRLALISLEEIRALLRTYMSEMRTADSSS
jgi:hypothetical protein